MNQRQQFLSDVTRSFLEARAAWVESEVAFITATLEQAVDDLVESFSEGDMPGEMRPLERLVSGELSPQWAAWKRQASMASDNTLLPSADFWKAVDQIETGLQATQPKPLAEIETIPELIEQKVTPAQICRIYGWVDGNGAPEIWRLQEEMRTPGKHTDNWVNPNQRRQQDQEAKERAISQRMADRQREKIDRLAKPGPESVEVCLRQGLSLPQIRKITKKTREEIFAEAERLGLPRPPESYDDVRTKRSPMEPELPEESARAFDAQQNRRGAQRPQEPVDDDDDVFDPEAGHDVVGEVVEEGAGDEQPGGAMTLEDEIVTYHRQGMSPQEIAAAVSQPDKKVGVAKVNSTLRRFEKDPSAFGVVAS